MNESQLISLGIETFKLSFYLAFPALLAGMLSGLIISIFQAVTQINEMTLSFIPKIISVVFVLVLAMPWMINSTIDYTKRIFDLIPKFVQ